MSQGYKYVEDILNIYYLPNFMWVLLIKFNDINNLKVSFVKMTIGKQDIGFTTRLIGNIDKADRL